MDLLHLDLDVRARMQLCPPRYKQRVSPIYFNYCVDQQKKSKHLQVNSLKLIINYFFWVITCPLRARPFPSASKGWTTPRSPASSASSGKGRPPPPRLAVRVRCQGRDGAVLTIFHREKLRPQEEKGSHRHTSPRAPPRGRLPPAGAPPWAANGCH
jgi:hypothetical protein